MNSIELITIDPWLKPFKEVIKRRVNLFQTVKDRIISESNNTLFHFANGYLKFGCFQNSDNNVCIREYLPNAFKVFLVFDGNNWSVSESFLFENKGQGIWEIVINGELMGHLSLYKLYVEWPGGSGERVPAWSRRVVQDEITKIFSAQVWLPKSNYKWKSVNPDWNDSPLIYEAHIGMAGEEVKVSGYTDFRKNVLPRIVKNGYNTIQLMAIQEHPYYGSFGYHVSSFFAPSSRFGTPEELKELIDEAHACGLKVIMDIVHSHAVKNHIEGLGLYDGTRYLYFHEGSRGEHPAWDSYCFNYGKYEVLYFLLSNIRYWMEEFHFDGFRFDGVTSMLYLDHGLGSDFTNYSQYFDGNQDEDAIVYLMLANSLMKEINLASLSIAEEMSGYPGMGLSVDKGGLGFDYRLAMGIPDNWIKLLKEKTDDQWDVGHLYYELTTKRKEERTISYTESHDQALVGDKTVAFWLMDKEMYFKMLVTDQSLIIDRGVALHKMIRLITISTAGGGYLNFMGNEFGHPEWIDFPREGNNWSYKYALRQWSLVDREDLKYQFLNNFDNAMIKLVKECNLLSVFPFHCIHENKEYQIIAFTREYLLFIFNFHPTRSFSDYSIPVNQSKYEYVLSTDELRFGGFSRIDEHQKFYANISSDDGKTKAIKVYLPSRTALVLRKMEIPGVRKILE